MSRFVRAQREHEQKMSLRWLEKRHNVGMETIPPLYILTHSGRSLLSKSLGREEMKQHIVAVKSTGYLAHFKAGSQFC